MNLEFNCPYCDKLLAVDEKWKNHEVECPHCNNALIPDKVIAKNKELEQIKKRKGKISWGLKEHKRVIAIVLVSGFFISVLFTVFLTHLARKLTNKGTDTRDRIAEGIREQELFEKERPHPTHRVSVLGRRTPKRAGLKFDGVNLELGMNIDEVLRKINGKVDNCAVEDKEIRFVAQPFGLIAKVLCSFNNEKVLWRIHCTIGYGAYSMAEFHDKLQYAVETLTKRYGEPTKQMGSFGAMTVPHYVGWKLENGNEIEYKYDNIFSRYLISLDDGSIPSSTLSNGVDYDPWGAVCDLATMSSDEWNKGLANQHYITGSNFKEKQNYDKAIEYFTKAIKLTPNIATLYHERGFSWMMKEQIDKAICDFSKAIELENNFQKAYGERGICYFLKNDYSRSISDLTKAIQLNPSGELVYIIWHYLGEVYKEVKDNKQAIECYNHAIRIKPDYAEAWCGKGSTYYSKNEPEKALQCLDKAIHIKPDYEKAWFVKGFIYYAKKDYEKALQCFRKAVQFRPEYGLAWFYSACVHSLEGDKTNCLKCLSKAIDIDSSYKEKAKSEDNFKNMHNDEDFRKLCDMPTLLDKTVLGLNEQVKSSDSSPKENIPEKFWEKKFLAVQMFVDDLIAKEKPQVIRANMPSPGILFIWVTKDFLSDKSKVKTVIEDWLKALPAFCSKQFPGTKANPYRAYIIVERYVAQAEYNAVTEKFKIEFLQ